MFVCIYFFESPQDSGNEFFCCNPRAPRGEKLHLAGCARRRSENLTGRIGFSGAFGAGRSAVCGKGRDIITARQPLAHHHINTQKDERILQKQANNDHHSTPRAMASKSLGARMTALKTVGLTKLRTLGPSPTAGSFDRNFQIDKSARFAFRGFQVLVAFASWFFIGRLHNELLIEENSLWPAIQYLWFLAICSPILSGVLVGQYFFSCLNKSWSSIKILSLELICDFCAFFGWLVCIGYMGHTMGTACAPGSGIDQCTNFNWVLAWGSFSIIFWFMSLAWDIKGFMKGVWGWGGERLSDREVDAEIRRMSRNQSRGSRWN
ncbi:hypothetical protein BDZ88DRAFT_119355 [Geranomyces variabilis]|nr:hypothetical protein BDZ88DRAFT_119355 [Geranomyces variabilis]